MDIDETMNKWYDAKEKIKILTDKIEKYRNVILYEMEKKGVNKIGNKDFSVCKRRMSRSYVTKDSLPEELWKKYCVSVKYDTFTITKKNLKNPLS